MRTQAEVDAFRGENASRKISSGRLEYEVSMYEACVPRLYWFAKPEDIHHNKDAFEKVVVPYAKKLSMAHRNGYGLLFLGDNGSGKSLFISYLLGRAVVRGFSVYYTTLIGLDRDIKIGFDDHAASKRLRMLLSSDFVAVDELGKEHIKREFISTQFEAILKERYDDGYPTLLASNLDYSDIAGLYGPTVESMIGGRYQAVQLESGDFRKKMSAKMRSDMGFM